VILALLPSAVPLSAAQAGGAKPEVNVVRSIKARPATGGQAPAGATVVEIELQSSLEFPVRDEIVILRIGSADFRISRSPDDGRLDTLFFVLSQDDFDQLPDGASMEVRYGTTDAGGHRWRFGKLNKSLLQR
jgi:hypothetical protein